MLITLPFIFIVLANKYLSHPINTGRPHIGERAVLFEYYYTLRATR